MIFECSQEFDSWTDRDLLKAIELIDDEGHEGPKERAQYVAEIRARVERRAQDKARADKYAQEFKIDA